MLDWNSNGLVVDERSFELIWNWHFLKRFPGRQQNVDTITATRDNLKVSILRFWGHIKHEAAKIIP